jgi:hypothetical protein
MVRLAQNNMRNMKEAINILKLIELQSALCVYMDILFTSGVFAFSEVRGSFSKGVLSLNQV